MYDLLIQNAQIIDGTGAPSRCGDVAVLDGKLICDPTGPARTVVDAAGRVLCPGFIDAHSHGDQSLGAPINCLCKSAQGITTELTGQCGNTFYPVGSTPQRVQMLLDAVGPFAARLPRRPEAMTDLHSFLDDIAQEPLTTNFKIYTGHAALRIAVMGFDNRPATADELLQMQRLLATAMEQGSMGMSSGLLYSPSGYASEEELIALCKVVAEYDGVYATHMRNEAQRVVASVEESIRVAEAAGCRLNISHHKICGQANWGLSRQTLQLVQQANDRGVSTLLDVYPYTASMTQLNVCLPAAFFANGPEQMQRLLRDPAVRADLKAQMLRSDGRYRQCGGFDGILVAAAPQTPACCGQTISEYAASLSCDPFDAFFDILADNGHGAMAIYFSMSDEDLSRIAADPNSVIGTDGLAKAPDEPTHPRCIGSFPRAIRLFVKEQKLLSLEQMIHKMTGLPAQRLNVPNKGIIRTGWDADLVLLDYDRITDRADYINCFAPNDGIETVWVGGTPVFDRGQLTGSHPGKFIPHPKGHR